jgi:hypothetical protein
MGPCGQWRIRQGQPTPIADDSRIVILSKKYWEKPSKSWLVKKHKRIQSCVCLGLREEGEKYVTCHG